MKIQTAVYQGSFPKESSCPTDTKMEFAFIGRSNVGKSSLINMLVHRKDLARISNRPGKTQTLNFYFINDHWHLVDLPGYGYAKVSKGTRGAWGRMIEEYLTKRENLLCAFVLIDSNIPPQAIDLDFINWLGEKGIPFVIAYTKTDRLSKNQLQRNIQLIQEALLKDWNELPQQFITAAIKTIGRDEMLAFLDQVISEHERR